MTPDEARTALDNDPDIRSAHLFAISVLEEAAFNAGYEECAKQLDELGHEGLANHVRDKRPTKT